MPVSLAAFILVTPPIPAKGLADDVTQAAADGAFDDELASEMPEMSELLMRPDMIQPDALPTTVAVQVLPLGSLDDTKRPAPEIGLTADDSDAVLSDVQFAALLTGIALPGGAVTAPRSGFDASPMATRDTVGAVMALQGHRIGQSFETTSKLTRSDPVSGSATNKADATNSGAKPLTSAGMSVAVLVTIPSVAIPTSISGAAFDNPPSSGQGPLPIAALAALVSDETKSSGQPNRAFKLQPSDAARAELPSITWSQRGGEAKIAGIQPAEITAVSLSPADISPNSQPLAPLPIQFPAASASDGATPLSQHNAPDLPMARHAAHQMAAAVAHTHGQTTVIRLDPEELGQVKLSLQTGDAAILVTIQADRPETVDLMRRHIDQLAHEFRSLGFQDVSFSFGEGQDRSDSQTPAPGGIGAEADNSSEAATADMGIAPTYQQRSALAGHLDLRL